MLDPVQILYPVRTPKGIRFGEWPGRRSVVWSSASAGYSEGPRSGNRHVDFLAADARRASLKFNRRRQANEAARKERSIAKAKEIADRYGRGLAGKG